MGQKNNVKIFSINIYMVVAASLSLKCHGVSLFVLYPDETSY